MTNETLRLLSLELLSEWTRLSNHPSGRESFFFVHFQRFAKHAELPFQTDFKVILISATKGR